MPFLEIRNVTKSFGPALVLRQVSLCVEKGTILCILGASGSGKTTLLRVIAGLEEPDGGEILCQGRNVLLTRPHLRRFGMMFQEYALFPHLRVSENIAFGLRMLRLPESEIRKRIDEMLSLVGLEGFGSRRVGELSGGERQRVALARSLAPYPLLLLLDEPVGSLDRGLRERLLKDLRDILRRIGMTTIVVTHDQAEAFAVSDLIAVMDKGRIVQTSTPEELYRRPATPEIARFLGMVNLVQARILDGSSVTTPMGRLTVQGHGRSQGEAVTLLVRPDAARLLDLSGPVPSGENILEGVVKDCLFKGRSFHVEIVFPGPTEMSFDIAQESPVPAGGQRVSVLLSPSGLSVMPA